MRAIYVLMLLIFAGLTLPVAAQSPEPILGVWMLDVARSNLSPAPRINITTWEPWQGAVKVTTYTVNAAGAASYLEVITKLDGVDAPVEGAAAGTTRAYRRTGQAAEGTTYEYVEKVNGQVVLTTRHTVSPDGNTRTSVDLTNTSGGVLRNRVFRRVR